jgi:hypothetical protein
MKKWYSAEAEQRNKEVVQQRCQLDQKLEEQRQYGGYTGPAGPTISLFSVPKKTSSKVVLTYEKDISSHYTTLEYR